MISLEDFKKSDKRKQAIAKLTKTQQVHLAGKFAELVLPIYEKEFPNDQTLRKVVNLVLEYPNHTEEEYVEARNIANASASSASSAAYYAADVVYDAAYASAANASAANASAAYNANRAGVEWNDLYNVFVDFVGNYEIEI